MSWHGGLETSLVFALVMITIGDEMDFSLILGTLRPRQTRERLGKLLWKAIVA